MKRVHVFLLILLVLSAILIFNQLNSINKEDRSIIDLKENWLERKYGPKLYSQNNEELIIRDFFQDRKHGFFIDVGASHYKIFSTTYYLEKHLDWKGISIDAIADYGADYLRYRKNTRFFCIYIGSKSDEQIDFYFSQKYWKSSSREDWAKRDGQYTKVKVPTITLDDLLEREKVGRFDFLSMDIELAEPEALAGFDIDKYKPSLVCIEGHEEVRDRIFTYFKEHNYKIILKYLEMDPLNFYFTPLFQN